MAGADTSQSESLFDEAEDAAARAAAPLAVRMRPRSLDEVVGQRHLTGPGAPFRKLIDHDAAMSLILWGPPGTGKTTLAHVVSEVTKRRFTELSAVTAGVKDVRAAIDAARRDLGLTGTQTLLFIDEVHRFNKAQQDALLPAVENRWVSFIGATTENPFFSVVGPLLSRSLLLTLEPLSDEDIRAVVGRAAVRYDRGGDQHYDVISAFIKSIRGSDADAAVHYLARMIEAGEDPRFIARRLIVHASEDVGMADPSALGVAVAAAHAVEFVGLPEARINLAQATIHLSLAPKSNAVVKAINAAGADVRAGLTGPVPTHLRDTSYRGAARLGHGKGYQYPHDVPEGVLPQQYAPDGLAGREYYQPTGHGAEARYAERAERIRAILAQAREAGEA